MQEYSSGFTSERLIKNEMTQIINLYLLGKKKDEIRDIVVNENLFNMRSVAAIKESLSKINRRISYIDENLMKIYILIDDLSYRIDDVHRMDLQKIREELVVYYIKNSDEIIEVDKRIYI